MRYIFLATCLFIFIQFSCKDNIDKGNQSKSIWTQQIKFIEKKFNYKVKQNDLIIFQYLTEGDDMSVISDTITIDSLDSYNSKNNQKPNLTLITSINNLKKDGPCIIYTSENDYSIEHYKNGKKDSLWITYFGLKSPLRFDTIQYKNNKMHGIYVNHLRSGEKVMRTHYVNGKITDTLKHYLEDGKLFRYAIYDTGKILFEECYDKDGNIEDCP